MALLNVLIFPDPRLNNQAKEVDLINDEVKQFAQDLFATMEHEQGVGLAAIQVNVAKRIIVVNAIKSFQPTCLINPVITKQSGNITWDEGCLSFPGVYTKVKRCAEITVEYQDLDGKNQVIENADGLLSVCLQHEIDHLNGITFYNRISPLRQGLLKNKLKNLNRR